MNEELDNLIHSMDPGKIFGIGVNAGRTAMKDEIEVELKKYDFDDEKYEDIREGIVKALNIIKTIKTRENE